MINKEIQEFSNFLTTGYMVRRWNNHYNPHNLNLIDYYSKIYLLGIYKLTELDSKFNLEIYNKKLRMITGFTQYVANKYITKCIIGNLSNIVKDELRTNEDDRQRVIDFIDLSIKNINNKFLTFLHNTKLDSDLINPIRNLFIEVKELILDAEQDIIDTGFLYKVKNNHVRYISMLKNVTRWNNTPLNGNFSILSHQFITAIIKYVNFDYETLGYSKYNSHSILVAAFHDLLEAEMDDVIRPIKNIISETCKISEQIAYDDLLKNYKTKLDIRNQWFWNFLPGKEFDTNLEFYNGEGVKFCDNISAYSELSYSKRCDAFNSITENIISGSFKVSKNSRSRIEQLKEFIKQPTKKRKWWLF